MKEKLALVIAALLITSMAFAISTTTVTAPSTFSASGATATLNEPDPARVRANTRVLINITVTNDSTTDNIDNVWIEANTLFKQAIGGASAAENLKLAADNMENAVAPLRQAGENLKLAEDNNKAAGSKLSAAAVDQDTAAGWLLLDASENVRYAGGQLRTSATKLGNAGENLSENIENWAYISSLLSSAGTFMSSAGTFLIENDVLEINDENILENAGLNLQDAGTYIGSAATAIGDGSLRAAGENLKLAADNITDAGENLNAAAPGTARDNAGDDLRAVATLLDDAGDYLVAAAQADNYAGQNLVSAAAYLSSAGALIELADNTNLKAAGDNIENAAVQIGVAGDNLSAIVDNVQQAGENLSNAATYLATAALELGAALGGDELANAVADENAAAENMLDVEQVDLTTAGDELIAASLDLSAAAIVLETTAGKLVPDTWTMSTGAEYVQFNAWDDNIIAPTLSETFGFLWTTPTITTEENYTLGILTSIEELVYTEWDNFPGGLTLTVDGKVPTLTIVVTQTGVVNRDNIAVENVVGTVHDNAKATITVTASELLQSIGTITILDNDRVENILPPITIGMVNVRENTVTFPVENDWDDNSPLIVLITSAKDIVGNENTDNMEASVTVDTRAPVFIDNGLPGFIIGMARKNVAQAGTDITFNYVDNNADQNISIFVQDNALAEADNDFWVISVTIGTTNAAPDPTIADRWFKATTMSEGLTSVVKITATDRTGNTVSDNIENIFIDTKPPTIKFEDGASITRMIGRTKIISGVETEVTFSSGVRINDNTPKIEVIVSDQGYTSTGIPPALGVARENLKVYLDDDENFLNGTIMELDNKDPWKTQAEVYAGVFENVIENAVGGGLADGTYYIWVFASDNLTHDRRENENASRSFILDTVVPTILNVTNKAVTSILDLDLMEVIESPTQETTMLVKGVSDEAESTIYIYVGDNLDPVGTVTAGTDGKFQVEITLSEGTNVIYFKEVDLAGNESDRGLYATYIVDKTPPVITITTPVVDETTDKAVITVSGTVIDNVAKYDELYVTVDATGTYVAKRVYLNPDGSFSTSVPLVEGSNVINVIAIDTADVQKVASVTVTRTVTSWAIYAIIVVIVALVLAAIAIFRKR